VNSERIVAFAETLAQTAAAGGGAKALAARLAEATGCAVLLEDARWQPIAASETAGATVSARAILEDGAPGRALKVVAGESHVGWLSVTCNGARNDTAVIDLLMRLASAAIAVELARGADGDRGGRRKVFWERLLERAYHDAGAVRDDAAARGIALAPAYLAVALEPDNAEVPGAREQLRALATAVFRSRDADAGILERGAAVFLFVPAGREVDASNARTAAMLLPKNSAKRHPDLRFSGGVGTVETPLALYLSAERAQAALSIGRRVFGAGRVCVYDELGAYPLLYEGADVRRLEGFARRVLEPLREYDRKQQTELERTLRLFFAVGQNVKTAAAELSVHRHTVFYRLRQIGEICGCSLDNPHDQLTLRLAVAIDALHSS
jgi:sugar diacid utilization regulator